MLATQTEIDNELVNRIYVELSFSITGQSLPADHGYGLYSAIAHICPFIHECDGISIQTIVGIPDRKGKIYLAERSNLRIRILMDYVPLIYPLAGKMLEIGGHKIQLGIPQLFMLSSASSLRARLVVIKNHEQPDSFLEAAKLQLAALGISGTLSIPLNERGEADRKTIKIKTYSIVGFGVEVSDLSDEDTLKLQIKGLGGKRRMGCGVFVSKEMA